MKRLFLFALICIAFTACDQPGTIEDISWILGQWKGVDDNTAIFHERWVKENETTYTGSGCSLTPEGDTLFKEALKINVVEGVPYYVATIPENPGPVLFRLVKGDATTAVFENKEHDFPQRIAYSLETKNTMSVKLEGVENGRPKIEMLRFERVNDEILKTFPQPEPPAQQQDTSVIIKFQ
jgi:hypothetical protein